MKRTIVEVVLVLALICAGFFGWQSMQKGNQASTSLAALETAAKANEESLKESEKKVKAADEAIAAAKAEAEPLKAKALELEAVKAAIATGPLLQDVEGLYKQQKVLSVERQLGLGALRMLTKGSTDPGVAEAFQKALQLSDWSSRKNTICAAQIGLAAIGEKVKVMSECAVQPSGAGAESGHGDAPAADEHGADKANEHGTDKGKEHGAAKKDAHAAPHWGYEGAMGPERWVSQYPTCGNGKSQAPLNIRGPFVKGRMTVAPDYKPGPLRLLNNGHTVQVNVPTGSKLRIDGIPFDLLQFHFHRPSEEQIDGKPMEMVVHFVHKSADGKLAVLGVLLKEGNENPGIKTLWSYAPATEGPEVAPDEVVFNPGNLLPKELQYFSYEGSLTTPPCTEGVRFFILKTPVNISREQINNFPFRRNARPVQPLNDRVITEG
ncbi:MAG: carbonic anhydrase family protein [Bacteroidota bacterium]